MYAMVIIESDNRKIKIRNEVLQGICNYIQTEHSDIEAGGILIGRENRGNQNIVIEYSTEPMKEDIRSRIRYFRKDSGHVEYYKKLYDENNEIYAYYGEWHTHPEDNPSYSFVDWENWKSIAKKDPKGIQYHIIAGRKSFVMWEMRKGRMIPQKIGEVKWNEIIF